MSSFACPQCGKKYAFREGMAGRKAKCGECNTTFAVAAPGPTASPSAPAVEPVASHVVINFVAPELPAPSVAPAAPTAIPSGIPTGVPVGVPVNIPTAVPVGVPIGIPVGQPVASGMPYRALMQPGPGQPGQPGPLGGVDGLLAADSGAAGPIAYRRKAKMPWRAVALGSGVGACLAVLIFLILLVANSIGK